MKKFMLIAGLLLFASTSSFAQRKFSFTNDYANWNNRTDYFNWKIYLNNDNATLASIKQVEYYLDPSFKNSKRIVTRATGGNNFTLCTNGWGEFRIRIKIVFNERNKAAVYETYDLDLHSRAKKKTNYRCP